MEYEEQNEQMTEEQRQKERKRRSRLMVIRIVGIGIALFLVLYLMAKPKQRVSVSDDMKIPHAVDLNDRGAAKAERKGDHANSPYYLGMDFYNAGTGSGFYILPKFRTIQQTAWWSSGACAVLMTLDHYGCLGDWNEQTLSALCADHSAQHEICCLDQVIGMLRGASDLTLETTYDHEGRLDEINCAWIRKQIESGYPVIVGWNDWGGHWQVIIGYDTMDTENNTADDVIIVADSFDTTDHSQDGYGVYSAERFIYNFDFYDLMPEDHPHKKCFVVVKPAEAAAQAATNAEAGT